MTNPHRGDVAFSVGAKTYTLRYTHLALVKLEKALDKGIPQIMSEIASAQNLRLGTVVSLLWAGLQKHHPAMTEENVAELLDEIEGGMAGAMMHLDEAFGRAFNAPGTKGTNPPKANGTGTVPSPTTSASAMSQTASGMSPHES